MISKQLEGKKALVTGGAQGLGEAICLRLAQEGCDVLIADINDEVVAKTAATIAESTGRDVFSARVDVTDEDSVESAFKVAEERFGKIDIVVANAAILIAEPIMEADAEKWRAVMNVNLFGTFLTLKHAASAMKKHSTGSIITINSKSGKKGSAANSAYSASKFGGIGLVQSVALELAPLAIRCNAICPGNLLDGTLWMDSEKGLFRQYLEAGKVPGAKTIEDVKEFYTSQVPMKRGCSYEDVCNMVVYLGSDNSSYMTGQALNVTGGQIMY